MKISDKVFFTLILASIGFQFLLGSAFLKVENNEVNQILASFTGVLSLSLSILVATNSHKKWTQEIWKVGINLLFVILLLHALTNAYKNPILGLQSVNLILTATAVMRLKNWTRNTTQKGPYFIAFVVFVSCALVVYMRQDLINVNTFLATKYLQPLLFFGTIEILLIHIASNFKLEQGNDFAKNRLSSRVQFQNDLISIISHNIRTPLSHIYTKLEIEKMRKGDTSPLLLELSESVEHLVNIVETTLNNRDVISHANESKPVKELFVKLDKLYKDQIFLSQNGIGVQHQLENYLPILFGLQNFIDNAIKWSSKDKPSVFIKMKEDHLFAIVADRGPGMSMEHLKVFGNPVISNGPKSGKGLGIYFTIGLLTTLGYDILVKTAINKGVIIMVFEPESNNYNAFMEKGWVYKYFPAFAKDEAIIEDLTGIVPSPYLSKFANTPSK